MASTDTEAPAAPAEGAAERTPDWAALSERIGHSFADPALLRRALTHRSAAQDGREGSYERLEFLGDRVLGLVVAELLYKRFPNEAEGALAQRLSELVRRETLGDVGTALGLGRYLRLAKGEEAAGERRNPALLANACEAVFGALYLDGGLDVARRLIETHWMALIEADRRPPRDAKTALQEWAQGRGLPLPAYSEVSREGPDHEPYFTVEVVVGDKGAARGEGRSKRLAEQAAAERLLARFRTGEGTDA